MSARNLNFLDTLPQSAIYADSSFILNLITRIRNRQERFQIDCQNFLKRIQIEMDTSGLCLVTSDFAIDEVCFKIIREGLERKSRFPDLQSGKIYNDWMDLFKNKPVEIQNLLPTIENFYNYLDSIPFFIISYPELKDLQEPLYLQVKGLIASNNLLPADAYHVAIGRSAGIDNFVAIDTDWFRIDCINLYTCLPLPTP